jgi:acyl carrier protein
MDIPSFEELARLIREHQGFRSDKRILPEFQFERDLGVTGDDGVEILDEVQKRFGLEFSDESFGLDHNEYLFHPEGFAPFPFAFQSLFGQATPTVRPFTVGELYSVFKREMEKKANERDAPNQ